jgi:TPR repeat protein
MAIFGAYETTEELERTPFSVVFRAVQADAKARSPFVVKTIDLDATAVDPQTLDAKNEQFLSAVRVQQKISDRGGSCHWAPVHDLGTVRGRAFYVTDCYPRTVAGMIKGRVKISPRALYSVTRGVIKGLEELNQLCRRPHGNLKTSNVLIADPDLDPTEVYLSDPCPDEQLPAEKADAADMNALGRLIYQLVTHRPFPEVGGWPIQMSADWQRLGRKGKDWLAFANQLLDPLSEKPMTLEQAAAALKKLGAPPILSGKHVLGVVAAACVAVAAFGIYKFIQRGGTVAKQVNAQTQPGDVTPALPRVDPILEEIQNHHSEIEKRIPALEGSRDPLLGRFASLVTPATTQPVGERNRQLAELDALSKELVEAVTKEYASIDRGYFNQQAAVHRETKNKSTLTVEEFQRWLKEVKDPQYIRLDEKVDPRKGWQPITALRAAKLRLDELGQMKAGAAEVHQPEVEKLNAAITNTRQRRWNNAQKPLIEAEMKEIDGRLATLAAKIDSALNAQQGADAKLAQLRAKLSSTIILSDDSLQARWNQSRQQILDLLKKDPSKIEDLAKQTIELQTRLTQIDQGCTESTRLFQQNDFINAIDKLDRLIATYPDEAVPRKRRSAFGAPLYERSVKELGDGEGKVNDDEVFKCLLISAGLADPQAERIIKPIHERFGATARDAPALLALFRRSAEGGDAAAMNIVGLMFEDGWGTTADMRQAVDWYTKSANAGFGGAMHSLGFLYINGKGVKQDDAQAAAWFKKGAEAGYVTSMKNLARLYRDGRGVAKDPAQTVQWYRKAAEAGDVIAMTELAQIYERGELVPRDFKESVNWHRKAAEAGDLRAMIELAQFLEQDEFVPRDLKESAKWYRKAAEAGDAHSMVRFSEFLEGGEVLAKDEAEAFKWYTKAAAAGEYTAYTHLGNMYEEGRGVVKDEAKAFELYQKSLTKPDPNAHLFLARMYESGRGTAKDETKAFQHYGVAAYVIPSAMFTLGTMYRDGRGTQKDPKKALELFKLAAGHDEPAACKELGMMYLKGDGVEKDPSEAAKWMGKAADAGDPAAMSNMGVMYLNGQGVAKDEKKALEHFKKAADAGNAGAMANLGVMYKNGRGVAKDLFEAFEWYKRGAEAKDTLAMNNLGLMYQNGQGTKQDYPAALRWFKAGADAGDSAAMNNLGIMYELGQGVARNPAEAAKWFKAAAEAGEATAQKNLDRIQRAPTNQPRRDRIGRQPPP